MVYGICTNTGGKKDGTPCSKCQNKEIQAVRASKEFVCEECGEPLTKVDPPKPKIPKWFYVILALVVIGGGIGAYFGFSRDAGGFSVKGSDSSQDSVHLCGVNHESERTADTAKEERTVDGINIEPGSKPMPGNETQTTKTYSFGKYVGNLKNGIPEGDGKMEYNCRIQIAKHDTDNPPHYAEAGDRFEGTWGNGDIVTGALYSRDGKIKEKIFAPKRFNPYDLNLDNVFNE